MEVTTPATEHSARARQPPQNFFTRAWRRLWSLPSYLLANAVESFLLPLMQLLVRLVVIFVLSFVVYVALYVYLLPKALVKEPVYFDYSESPPVARISLLSHEKQWQYLKQNSDGKRKETLRYLRSGSLYTLDAIFVLSKSTRNLDLGKFMVHATLVDSTGDAIAKSSRPVVIPYQSLPSLVLESLVKFPLRIIGLAQLQEASSIRIDLMNDYREPLANAPATELIELVLSTPNVDIGEVYLTIMPVLKGVTYYMHYYPHLSFLIGISVLMGVQISLFSIYLFISLAIKYINSLSQFDNEEEEEEQSEPTVSQASEDAEDDDPSGTFYNSTSAEASLRRRTFAAAAGGGEVRNSHEGGSSGGIDDNAKKEHM